MATQSKYYNLDSHGPDWTKEEFSHTVLKLESLSKNQLIEICQKLELSFPSYPWESITEEDIIGAVIDDYPKETIIKMLESY